MDLLDPNNALKLYDDDWRIYTKSKNLPPQFIAAGANVKHSMINEGCVIEGAVENSILFSSVRVEEGAEVKNSVILSDCVIKSGAKVNRAITLEGVVVAGDARIGQEEEDKDGIYLVTEDEITKE